MAERSGDGKLRSGRIAENMKMATQPGPEEAAEKLIRRGTKRQGTTSVVP
jgi:hypothetical protein